MCSHRFKEFGWISSVTSFTSSEKPKCPFPAERSSDVLQASQESGVLACSLRDDASSVTKGESLPSRIHSHHREPYEPWTMVTVCSACGVPGHRSPHSLVDETGSNFKQCLVSHRCQREAEAFLFPSRECLTLC